MINEVKSCIKKYMPTMPYIDSIMAAECIRIDEKEMLKFNDYDVKNFQLHNPVVLIEDEFSVQCYIDFNPYQKGVDRMRYFWEALYDDDGFKIVLGKIIKIDFNEDYSKYAGAVTIDCCLIAQDDEPPKILSAKKIYEMIPPEVIEGVGKNAVNTLKHLLKYYKNKQAVH